MKIIEAMKRIKANKEKINELQGRIAAHSAHLSLEKPVYEDQAAQVKEWLQSCLDTARDNVELLVRIQRTNIATEVTIKLGDKSVTKSIAEWVWRRREYSGLDLNTWSKLSDRGLRAGHVQTSPGVMTEVTLLRYFDPKERDAAMDLYRREPHEIDAALEVVNAVTDLVE